MTVVNYAGHWSRGGNSSVYEVQWNYMNPGTGTDFYVRIWFLSKSPQKKTTYYYKRSVIGITAYNNMIAKAQAGVGLNHYAKTLPYSLAT